MHEQINFSQIINSLLKTDCQEVAFFYNTNFIIISERSPKEMAVTVFCFS